MVPILVAADVRRVTAPKWRGMKPMNGRVRQFCHRNRSRLVVVLDPVFPNRDENEDEDDFSQTKSSCATETYKTVHWQALTKYESIRALRPLPPMFVSPSGERDS